MDDNLRIIVTVFNQTYQVFMPWRRFLFLVVYSPIGNYGGGQGSEPPNLKRCGRKIFRYRSPASIPPIYVKRE